MFDSNRYYQLNKQKLLNYQQNYYENNKEKYKKFYPKNRKYSKLYYQKNKNSIKLKIRANQKSHPEIELKYMRKLYSRIGLKLGIKKVKFALWHWSKIVKKRDNNQCVLCRTKDNLHAHHIFPKSRYPELALNINNGITLCITDHIEIEHGLGVN